MTYVEPFEGSSSSKSFIVKHCHMFQTNEPRKLSQTGTDSDAGWSPPSVPLHPTINEDNSSRYYKPQCKFLVDWQELPLPPQSLQLQSFFCESYVA